MSRHDHMNSTILIFAFVGFVVSFLLAWVYFEKKSADKKIERMKKQKEKQREKVLKWYQK